MPKVLVVDGSPMMHRIMELTFAPEGMQVITESDGDQAIALLPIVRPDIVIADHALSGKSGYEVAAFVQSHPDLNGVPVLLLASPFEPLDRTRAEACGVAGEISKPFEPAQLVARVRELLQRAANERATGEPVSDEPEDVPTAGETRASGLKLVETAAPRGALDDYFDRLDAALGRLDDQMSEQAEPLTRATSESHSTGENDAGLPTVDKLLANDRTSGPSDLRPLGPSAARGAVLIDHPLRGAYGGLDVAASGDPSSGASTPDPATDRGTDLSALVDALESLRRKNPGVDTPITPVPVAATARPNAIPSLSEADLEEITRRVIERLTPGAVNAVAIEVITKVAERLLREEIQRLSGPGTTPRTTMS
jgi:CheY-like chemotaxis protein